MAEPISGNSPEHKWWDVVVKDKKDCDNLFGSEEIHYLGSAGQFYDELVYLLIGMIKLGVPIRLIEFTDRNNMINHAIRINRWRNRGVEGYWIYFDMVYDADSKAWEVEQVKSIIRDNGELITFFRVKVEGNALREYLDKKSLPSKWLPSSRRQG